MAIAIGKIGHEERLSVVEHLDELRTRLIVSLAVLAVAFGFCLWQNHSLLHIVNRPLEHQTQKQVRAGSGPLGATYTVQQGARWSGCSWNAWWGRSSGPEVERAPRLAASLQSVRPQLRRAISRLSAAPQGNKPVTLGVGEPFTATLGVALLFALILALPIILYEIYSFLLPALRPGAPARRLAADPGGTRAVRGRGAVRLLRGAARRAALLRELQQRPIQRARAGQPVLPLRCDHPARDGAGVPGARRDPGGHPRGHRHAAPATSEPPLRDPGVRRGGGLPAR